MRSLIHFTRYLPDLQRRNCMLKHFQSEEDNGRVYWMCLASIDDAGCAHRVSSLRLFTVWFCVEILALRNDLVVNLPLYLLNYCEGPRLFGLILNDLPDHLCGIGYWQLSDEARELRVFLH